MGTSTHGPPRIERHRLTTTAGDVQLDPQNGRTIYVRAGLEDEDLILARDALDVRALVTFRGYWKFRDGRWSCPQPFVHRADQGRGKDPSGKAIARVLAAIADPLTAWAESDTGREQLAAAAHAEAIAAATERIATAHQLRTIADHLDTEARALRAGARVTHRRVTFNHRGASAQVTQVELPDGTLLPPPSEPPAIHGATRLPWHSVKTNEEVL